MVVVRTNIVVGVISAVLVAVIVIVVFVIGLDDVNAVL